MQFTINELAQFLYTTNNNSKIKDDFSCDSILINKANLFPQDYSITKSKMNPIETNQQPIFRNAISNKKINIYRNENSVKIVPKINENNNSIPLNKLRKGSQFPIGRNNDIVNLKLHVFLDNDKVDMNISVNKKLHIEELYHKVSALLGEKSIMIQNRKYYFHSKGKCLKINHTFE